MMGFSLYALSFVGFAGRAFYAGRADFLDGVAAGRWGGSFKSPWVTKGVETAVCTLRGGGIKIRKPAEVEDPDQNIPSTLQT